MMTHDELLEDQRRAREFAATEIGSALRHFENEVAYYWSLDSEPNVSDRERSAAGKALRERRAHLVALLLPLMGLKP